MNSPVRFTGLVSGMDTQTMVQQLMRAEGMRMERLTRRRTLVQWRQEAIRNSMTRMNEFTAKNTDFIKEGTITNPRTWNTIKATIDGEKQETDVRGISVVSGNDALMGSIKVEVHQTAHGDRVAGDVVFDALDGKTTAQINNTTIADAFGVGFLTPQHITFTSAEGKHTNIFIDSSETIGALISRVNNSDANVTLRFDSINNKFELQHKETGKNAKIITGETTLLKAMGLNNIRSSPAAHKDLNIWDVAGLARPNGTTAQDIVIKISDGTTIPIPTQNAPDNMTIEQFVDFVDSAIKSHGMFSNISFDFDFDPLSEGFGRFYFKREDDPATNHLEIEISGPDDGLLDRLGLSNIAIKPLASGETESITVAGLPSAATAMNSLLRYDPGAGYIKEERFLSEAQNAIISVDDGKPVERESNRIDIHGHMVTLSPGRVADNTTFFINAERDVTDTMDAIKQFVEEYNEMLRFINGLHSTPRPRHGNRATGALFEPLTDEERQGMSESEIERWEERAKTGLLHRDRDIRQLHNQMRNAMFNRVVLARDAQGNVTRSISLHEIGITTVGRNEGAAEDQMIGVLKIDEDALRVALEERGNDVRMLFSRTGMDANEANAAWYASRDEEPKYHDRSTISKRAQRAPEMGLGFRLEDIFRTYALDDRGPLQQRAGYHSGLMVSENTMTRQIRDYNDRISRMEAHLIRRENHYYNMFAKMEAAMQQSHAQMDSLFAFGQQ